MREDDGEAERLLDCIKYGGAGELDQKQQIGLGERRSRRTINRLQRCIDHLYRQTYGAWITADRKMQTTRRPARNARGGAREGNPQRQTRQLAGEFSQSPTPTTGT